MITVAPSREGGSPAAASIPRLIRCEIQ